MNYIFVSYEVNITIQYSNRWTDYLEQLLICVFNVIICEQ